MFVRGKAEDAALLAQGKDEITGVDARLDKIDGQLDMMEESLSEVRSSTNYLADWMERLEHAIPPKRLSELN